MKNMKIGDNYIIHCYKHDGTIHRSWDEAMLLDVKKDYLVFGNKKAKVNDNDGRIWYTKEPAIIFFYKKNKPIRFIFVANIQKNSELQIRSRYLQNTVVSSCRKVQTIHGISE